jgi:Transglycosylase SLT domain
LSIPRTFTSRNPYRKPARLTFAVAGTTAAAAALVAVGLSTASPGAPAALSAALAAHGGASTLPLAHLALDQTGSAGSRAPVHLAGGGSPVHLAGGGSPVTATGQAILASGRAAAQPRKPAPAARGGNRAPAAHQAKPAGQEGSSARPARHAHLVDRSARHAHHAATAHQARRGVCASSTLHWWVCSAEHALEEHGVSRGRLSTGAAYIVVQHESGANPRAYNGWDSNAAAGHPSEGIAQVIGPTFHAYALPGHHDIWNPVDNMIAAFRYAISRYGSMNNIPGVMAVRQGGSYMGY